MVVRYMSLTELVREENRRLYRVDFGYDNIFVTVTRNPDMVAFWILIVRMAYSERLREQSLIVGLRVEWRCSLSRPRHRYEVDILQLCVGGYCLIFQIGLANGNISQELVDFLGNRDITFVGVGIRRDVHMLNRDYGILFNENFLDLNALVSFRLGLQNAGFFQDNFGLRELSNLVLRMDYVRPITIIMSSWNRLFLSYDQILYAFADVYFCYLMGEYLQAWTDD